MKITNAQTNSESITINGAAADLCPGCSVDVGALQAVIRGSTFLDDGTNIYTVVVQPSAVSSTTEISPYYELEQGIMYGFLVVPILVIILIIRRQFARGDAFD
jgi:hypothetical protein